MGSTYKEIQHFYWTFSPINGIFGLLKVHFSGHIFNVLALCFQEKNEMQI
jgi:hypothetical protein